MNKLLMIICLGFALTSLSKLHGAHIFLYLNPIEAEKSCSGIEPIDCIYVINLKERFSKWERVHAMLESFQLNAQRVDGINGWKLPSEIHAELAGYHPVRLCPGQLGCLLSHLSVLMDAYKKKFQVIWVCEDDIHITENPGQLTKVIAQLVSVDPDWDILYTDVDSKNKDGTPLPSLESDFRPDWEYPSIHFFRERKYINDDIMQIRQRFGMYSALISRKGIEKILNYFGSNYLWTSYDIDIHYIPGIREYSLTRDVVTLWTGSGISDTENKLD